MPKLFPIVSFLINLPGGGRGGLWWDVGHVYCLSRGKISPLALRTRPAAKNTTETSTKTQADGPKSLADVHSVRAESNSK